MENEKYIKILEMSEDRVNGTEKWKSMNFIEKFIYKIITPVIEQKENVIYKKIQTLQQENESIQGQLTELSKKYKILSEQVQKDSLNTATLLADYNTKKASSESKYKAAIDILHSLNLKFIQNVRTFGEANKLELLEKLVNYLYDPNDNIRQTILTSSQHDDESKSILYDIDNFNDNLKLDLVNYLSDINVKWEDCVLFPNIKKFNSQIMIPFNDIEIEEGDPIYIISLGFAFPNSNSEKQLPNVFKCRTK